MPKTLECVAYFHHPSAEIVTIIARVVAIAVTGRIENPTKPLPSKQGRRPLLITFVMKL